MKKKVLLSLLVIVALFTITGCGKGVKEKDEKTGKDKTVYTCIKRTLIKNLVLLVIHIH